MSLRYLLLNQLKSLRQEGYEVTGISSPGPETEAIQASGVRHLPVKITRTFTPLADLRSLQEFYRTFRREKFTIVHTHNPKPGLLGQLAARLAGVPIVINTLHGFYFHDHMSLLRRRFYIIMEKIAARCSDVILPQNIEDIETALREGICQQKKIKHLGNGIDAQCFSLATLSLKEIGRRLREITLPTAARVIGFVGRLVQEKCLPGLLEAARIMGKQVPAVHFFIIGRADDQKLDALTPKTIREYVVVRWPPTFQFLMA